MSDQELNLKFVKEVEKHEELYNYKFSMYSRRFDGESMARCGCLR
jgi:hypothetical protein